MPRASDARTRLVKTAISLFRRRGYHGVGLTELLTESGAPKGSFYHHFPGGKEALAVEAVRTAGARIGQMIDEAFTDAADMDDGAARLVRALAEGFARSDYSAGCPVVGVLIETVPGSDPLSEAGGEVLESWAAILARHAERFGDTRQIRQMCLALLIAIEGGWALARIRRDKAPILLAAHAFRMADPR